MRKRLMKRLLYLVSFLVVFQMWWRLLLWLWLKMGWWMCWWCFNVGGVLVALLTLVLSCPKISKKSKRNHYNLQAVGRAQRKGQRREEESWCAALSGTLQIGRWWKQGCEEPKIRLTSTTAAAPGSGLPALQTLISNQTSHSLGLCGFLQLCKIRRRRSSSRGQKPELAQVQL